MPCYQSPQETAAWESLSKKSNVESNTKLEGMLCAIMNELERRGISDEVVVEASRNGLVDIMSWWNKHSISDVTRVAEKLHQFSKDEQAIMRVLLEEK